MQSKTFTRNFSLPENVNTDRISAKYEAGILFVDVPVENTAKLLTAGRRSGIPIIYTTSPWRPDSADQPFKSAADYSDTFRIWDEHACQIDARVAPLSDDFVIEKENATFVID